MNLIFSHGSTVIVGLDLLNGVPGPHSDILQTVGILRTWDHPDAETYT